MQIGDLVKYISYWEHPELRSVSDPLGVVVDVCAPDKERQKTNLVTWFNDPGNKWGDPTWYVSESLLVVSSAK